MEGLSKITYKNKTILVIDHSSFAKDKTTQKENTINLLRAATGEFINKPLKSVLTIVNVENLYIDMDTLKVFKEEGEKIRSYELFTAVIGVKGIAKAAYNFVVGLTNPYYKVHDSEQQAKDWLVRE
jgi:hypothetical protein